MEITLKIDKVLSVQQNLKEECKQCQSETNKYKHFFFV